ncbi:MAG TPA: hypothetical protein VF066_02385 [Thermoleophilaceae bacterium]
MARRLFVICLTVTALLSAIAAQGVAARPQPQKLRLPSPAGLTDQLRAEIIAQAPTAKDDPTDLIFKSCPGAGPTVPGVQAGTCLVDPFGCTANFVFYNGPTVNTGGILRPAAGSTGGTGLPPYTSDGQHWFLGTAGHCLNGGPVLAQVRAPGLYVPGSDAGGIAAIGTTAKKVNGGIGNDFGTIQLYAGQLVTPATPIGGPLGVYDQGVPAPINYYGHGYIFAVAQGKPGAGGAFFGSTDYYSWAGTSLPGDSGSGVMVGQLAAGDLTHGLGIGIVPLPVGYGTRMAKIFKILGRGFYMVNADGSLVANPNAATGPKEPWAPLVKGGRTKHRRR